MSNIGDKFQQETKYEHGKIPGHRLIWEDKPALYKEYPKAQKIELTGFEPSEPLSLDRALRRRKSIRDFRQEPMSKEQLSYLFWASTGIQRVEDGCEFRTAPSAGALYPIETYLIINDVRAENLALAAVSLNLGSCEVGALYDDHVNAILGIDGIDESMLRMAVVGAQA